MSRPVHIQHRQILEAARKVFLRRGYSVSTRLVARAAGVSEGSLFKRFKDKVVIMCCESGMRSSAAARVLQAQGFTKVVNLRGGVQAWRTENLPLVKEGGGKTKPAGNKA